MLFNCPECSARISTQATACPHCGYVPNARMSAAERVAYAIGRDLKKSNRLVYLFAGLVLVGFIALGLIHKSGEPPREKDETAVPSPAPSLLPDGSAFTVPRGYPMCTSHEYLSQFRQAIANRDVNATAWLTKEVCVVTAGGNQATVLDHSIWSEWAKIRVYDGEGSTVAYIAIEAIQSP